MFSTSRGDGRTLVALVATTPGRRKLLLDRAVPSIKQQTIAPDRIVVVVDSPDAQDVELLGPTLKAEFGHERLVLLRNYRTPQRAAASWNTGLDWLQRQTNLEAVADTVYVAILDDDDAWEPQHLQSCFTAAVESDSQMVVPGFIRHESPHDEGRRQSLPRGLDPRECFERNPHIGGSNLFVRLDALLAAGCFDEHLPSCTDRDLCIRLADLPNLKVHVLEEYTVRCFADPRPDRLSTPGSLAKLEGLTRFYRKHGPRFGKESHQKFCARAKELFGWSPPEPRAEAHPLPPLRPPPRPVHLVVGFATDADCPGHVKGLLDDLLTLSRREGVAGLDVVVVENGPVDSKRGSLLRETVSQYVEKGLRAYLVDVDRQNADLAEGFLVDLPQAGASRLPIAVTRTIVASYVGRLAKERPGSWAWVLDDDKRLEVLIDTGADGVKVRPTPDLAELCRLQDEGVDVVLGPDTDAAPLPFVATVRTQLVDVLGNLQAMLALPPAAPWPDRSAENGELRRQLKDSYYDLSRLTEHLETRFWVPPPDEGTSVADVLDHLSNRIGRILAGEQVTRPLLLSAADLEERNPNDSTFRGGSAFFFKPEVLLEVPNSVMRLGETYTRRSDIVVTQLMRDLGLRCVSHAAAAVRHDRQHVSKGQLLREDTLRIDVLGYAVSRALDRILEDRRDSGVGPMVPSKAERSRDSAARPMAPLTAEDKQQVSKLAKKYLNERLSAFTLNTHRVVGLSGALQETVRAAREHNPHGHSPEALSRIGKAVAEIAGNLKPTAVRNFCRQVRKSLTLEAVKEMLDKMPERCKRYQEACGAALGVLDRLARQREAIARATVRRLTGVADVRLLGAGNEAVVFTDDTKVYKVFDYRTTKDARDPLELLTRLCGKLDWARRICRLERLITDGPHVVLVYPYEPGEPYAGGRGTELIELLHECRKAGFVCRNVHPKNLVVTASGLKLIDYGSDLRPFSDAGYRSMAQRCWLTWRWHHRPDLAELMRAALRDQTLPELDGFDRFFEAANADVASPEQQMVNLIEPLIRDSSARTVLDYGCGRAGLVKRLAAAGLSVTGYDPGREYPKRWIQDGLPTDTLKLTTDRSEALGFGPFDAVVCSLVVCEVCDDAEYRRVLADLRGSVRENGVVYLGLCHPSFTFGGPTPLHVERHLPPGARYEQRFEYTERTRFGRVPRRECHRPLSMIERDLLRAGLVVERTLETQTVDTERFEPASDFLVMVCRPARLAGPREKVSLMIKTCAQEWRTLEQQVEHLVRQLEGPRAFEERVLVVDVPRSTLLRQYAPIDPAEHAEAVKRLLARGLVDRVVEAPADGRDLNRRWFGLDVPGTHTRAGVPVAATLAGFEACVCDLILQVDSDLMIGRRDRAHDYLGEMLAAMEADPKAATVALNIAQREDRPYTAAGENGPWRVEVRGSLVHRGRLRAALPFPNTDDGGCPGLTWYRSVDRAVKDGQLNSLRGGDRRTFFVHPTNDFKRNADVWMATLDLVEPGDVPACQLGKVDVAGGFTDWLLPRRRDRFIFMVTGRNVPPGRMRRGLDSLLAQRRDDWGAVVVDDASDPLTAEYLRLFLARYPGRFTLMQPRLRRGQLANMTASIRHVCADGESVIVTFDIDDALIGPGVLDRLAREYDAGADVTVGSMLRTDKHKFYEVDVVDPRGRRGGNVWQHLRTFKKRLFDAIPDHELRVGGRYVDIAVDWSFMLPVVESSSMPVWIKDPLYLYETSGLGKHADRGDRDTQIAAITRRPRLTRLATRVLEPLEASAIARGDPAVNDGLLLIRHAERSILSTVSDRRPDEPVITNAGREAAKALGAGIGRLAIVVASPTPRCMQTAQAIAAASDTRVEHDDGLRTLVVDRSKAGLEFYRSNKRRFGQLGLLRDWIDGCLAPGLLLPVEEVAVHALRAGTRRRGYREGPIVAVTHGFVIIAVLAALRGSRTTVVPYLGCVQLSWNEVEGFLKEMVMR